METVLLGMAALACPVGMGVTMWFMAKGVKREKPTEHHSASPVHDLRAEHERLGQEIQRLEAGEKGERPLAEAQS